MNETHNLGSKEISVVLPIYNEAQGLDELFTSLHRALNDLGSYEIIAVDDGSKDESFDHIARHAKTEDRVVGIRLARNAGQTAALQAGIDCASGKIIVMMDSDLENDPNDIGKLVAKIDEGYDVVSGWRKARWKEQKFSRKLPSWLANSLISKVTKVKLNDYGCTLKAYRSHVIKPVRLYGEMHRFIPAYAAWYGAKITEVEVNFTPRKYGTSNYGFSRLYRVLVDLLLVKFLDKYMSRPIHFFGGFGSLFILFGSIAGFASVVMKLIDYRSFVETPLPIFSALLLIIGFQFILMGVIAEILMRTYYESQDRRQYVIAEKVN